MGVKGAVAGHDFVCGARADDERCWEKDEGENVSAGFSNAGGEGSRWKRNGWEQFGWRVEWVRRGLYCFEWSCKWCVEYNLRRLVCVSVHSSAIFARAAGGMMGV